MSENVEAQSNQEIAQYLATFAVKTNRSSKVKWCDMSVEDARARVEVKNRTKKPIEGSTSLGLNLGRRKLSLDKIAPGTTSLLVTNELETNVTESLLQMVHDGFFDEAIANVQAKEKAPQKPAVAKAPVDDLIDPVTGVETPVEDTGEDIEQI